MAPDAGQKSPANLNKENRWALQAICCYRVYYLFLPKCRLAEVFFQGRVKGLQGGGGAFGAVSFP